jgi:hypothetical protein
MARKSMSPYEGCAGTTYCGGCGGPFTASDCPADLYPGIMTMMVVRYLQGKPIEMTLTWAESGVEGFMRT